MLRLLISALALAGTAGTAAPSAGDSAEWRFRVTLDDREIGFHRYSMTTGEDGVRVVESEAEFDVRFLFFNAYSYRHSLSARWDGDCLESLTARTNANGRTTQVSAHREDNEFVVETGEGVGKLPPCVMNFAYWDSDILTQSRLLNPQTGEYLDVEVQQLGTSRIEADGKEVLADAYRITARDMRIDVWYAQDGGRWLALESLAKGDRIIRYELA